MALADYNELFQVSKKKMYVTICIYRCMEYAVESQINHMLSDILDELKKELLQYDTIEVSYVYETEGLMEVRNIGKISEDTRTMFSEACNRCKNHDLNHVFYMGMAILKQHKQKMENAEYRQYLVTDEKFKRTDQLLWETNGKSSLNPAFADVDVKLCLYKSENAGDDVLEDFIKKHQGEIVEYRRNSI